MSYVFDYGSCGGRIRHAKILMSGVHMAPPIALAVLVVFQLQKPEAMPGSRLHRTPPAPALFKVSGRLRSPLRLWYCISSLLPGLPPDIALGLDARLYGAHYQCLRTVWLSVNKRQPCIVIER